MSEASCRVTDSQHGASPMKSLKKFCARTRTRKVCPVSPLVAIGPAVTPRLHLSILGTPSFDSASCVPLQYYFTVTFNHDNQKALELRTEDVKDCDEWVAAITQARYALTCIHLLLRRGADSDVLC